MKKAEKNIQSPALSNTFPTSSSSSLSPSPSSIPITSNIASEPSIIVHTTVSTSSALLKDNALASSTVRNTLQAMTQVIHTKQQQVQQQQQQEQLELTLLTALDDAVSYTIDTNDLSPDDHTTMSMMGTIQQIESTIQFKTTMIQESSLPTSTATTPLPLPISINNTHHDNQTDIEEVVINTTDLDSLSLLTSTISSQETIPNINPLHSSSSSSSSSSSMRTVSKPSSIDEELSHYTQLLEEAVLIRNSLQDLEDIEAKKLRQVSVLIFFLIGYILIFLSFVFVSIKKTHIFIDYSSTITTFWILSKDLIRIIISITSITITTYSSSNNNNNNNILIFFLFLFPIIFIIFINFPTIPIFILLLFLFLLTNIIVFNTCNG
jgi:hypothetical protein